MTHDPYPVTYGDSQALYIDLGAEQIIAAEQGSLKIAVEIKSAGERLPASTEAIYEAIGQYVVYRTWLAEQEPDRQLYLAVSHKLAATTLASPGLRVVLDTYGINLVIINIDQEEVVEWQIR